MRLTKRCKCVLDALLSYPPDLQNRFYTVSGLAGRLPALSQAELWAALKTAANDQLLEFADPQNTCFMLLEKGACYKEYSRLESLERWKERGIGFAAGVLLSVTTAIILSVLGLS